MLLSVSVSGVDVGTAEQKCGLNFCVDNRLDLVSVYCDLMLLSGVG